MARLSRSKTCDLMFVDEDTRTFRIMAALTLAEEDRWTNQVADARRRGRQIRCFTIRDMAAAAAEYIGSGFVETADLQP